MTMPHSDDQHAATRHERRNGLWNIFDGLDIEVLGRLGLSEETLRHLLTSDTHPALSHGKWSFVCFFVSLFLCLFPCLLVSVTF
jgi:hypothetical protein